MPLLAEQNLKKQAKQHGFKKGSRRYNAYVYGTMNKLGILNSNHAGALGPDRLVGKIDLDYRPTFDKVPGIHIAVTVAIILLLWYFISGKQLPFVGGINGSGASTYNNVQSVRGWMTYQFNSLGANAGVLNGESN